MLPARGSYCFSAVASWPVQARRGVTYFVTGATGFIGRHLVERLLEREGDDPRARAPGLARPARRADRALGPARRAHRRRSSGDLAEPLLGRRRGARERAARHGRPLLPPRGGLRHDRRRDAQRAAQRRRHAQRGRRSPTTSAPGRFHHVSSVAVAGALQGPVHRGHVRRGPAARPPLPPHEVRGREARAHADQRRLARLPPGDRRRPLADRRDGQDRRALLLLQGDPEARAHALPQWFPLVGARARATRTSCRSTTWPRRWTTSPTSPASTGRPSTSSTRTRSAPATCSTPSPAPRTRRSSRMRIDKR